VRWFEERRQVLAERLLKKLKEARADIAQDILTTPPADYAAFRQAVGKAEGLDLALQLIEAYLKGKEDL
jgi:hypothetical protein